MSLHYISKTTTAAAPAAPAATTTTTDTLAARLFDALAHAGARAIFGVPGDFALPLFNEIRRSRRLPFFDLAHEPSAAFAADAAARFGRSPGVCMFTFGAGTLNAINPIAAAYAEHVPLIVISGAPGRAERARGLLIHHQVRDCDTQRRILAEVTVDHAVLADPATAPAAIARVIASCIAHSRPVYFEIPRDTAVARCEPVPATIPATIPATTVQSHATSIAAQIIASERGVVLVDIGLRRFGADDAAIRLTRALGWPVYTTFMGRGVLADHIQPPPPVWFGGASQAADTALFEGVDCIIGLGVIHSDTNHAGAPNLRNDHRFIDIQPNNSTTAAGHVPDIAIAPLVAALATEIARRRPPTTAPPPPPANRAALHADGAAPTPDDIARTIDAHFANVGSAPVISDVGDCLFASGNIAWRDFLASGYYATMGYGIPAALGVQAISGQRPIVVVGDGAFQMTGLELGRCKSNGWSPIVIVFDNAQWEMVRSFDTSGQSHDQPAIDYARLADSLGCLGHTVTTRAELSHSLALAHADPTHAHVLHVRLRQGVISRDMRRFIDAFRAARDRDTPTGPV